MWQKMLGLAIAGALGALARYGLAGWIQRWHDSSFPWGTLAVNVLGCFLFGLIWTLTENRFLIGPQWRTILLIGFLGSFTTFSAFLFETEQMIEHSQWLTAAANVLAELAVGFIAYMVGAALGRLL